MSDITLHDLFLFVRVKRKFVDASLNLQVSATKMWQLQYAGSAQMKHPCDIIIYVAGWSVIFLWLDWYESEDLTLLEYYAVSMS
jgi:hypothetical protein